MMNEEKKSVLAVDIGFAVTGWVSVTRSASDPSRYEVSLYSSSKNNNNNNKKAKVRVADRDAVRCQELARFLFDAIRESKPSGVIVELPTGGAQGARANRCMGMATGIIASVIEIFQLPAEWVTPNEVKGIVPGAGKAVSKREVQNHVINALDWPETFINPSKSLPNWQVEHVCDAAGAFLAAQHGQLVRSIFAAPPTPPHIEIEEGVLGMRKWLVQDGQRRRVQ